MFQPSSELASEIVNGDRRFDNRAGGIGLQNGLHIGDIGLLGADRKARAQRVRIVHPVGGVELGALQEALPDHVGGNVIENEVAVDIRNKVHIGIAGKERKLGIDRRRPSSAAPRCCR